MVKKTEKPAKKLNVKKLAKQQRDQWVKLLTKLVKGYKNHPMHASAAYDVLKKAGIAAPEGITNIAKFEADIAKRKEADTVLLNAAIQIEDNKAEKKSNKLSKKLEKKVVKKARKATKKAAKKEAKKHTDNRVNA